MPLAETVGDPRTQGEEEEVNTPPSTPGPWMVVLTLPKRDPELAVSGSQVQTVVLLLHLFESIAAKSTCSLLQLLLQAQHAVPLGFLALLHGPHQLWAQGVGRALPPRDDLCLVSLSP